MVDRINPIIPRNPDIFPVQPVALPRIDPQEREQRRREREEDEAEAQHEQERKAPRPRSAAPQSRPRREGGPTIDVLA